MVRTNLIYAYLDLLKRKTHVQSLGLMKEFDILSNASLSISSEFTNEEWDYISNLFNTKSE